jgi:UTP-glucose-1-phosphate uridylyltransferase
MGKWGDCMTIGEYLYIYDRDMYRKLMKIGRKQKKKKNNIELGDSIENLMRHDSYRRQGRRIRQTKWGG